MKMSIFKRSFSRGVNDELTRLGYVQWPSKLAADEVADAVGDQMPVDPAAQAEAGQPVPAETAASVAMTLIDAANQLVEAAGGPQEMPAEGMEEAKMSAAQDLDTRAGQQAYACMVKSAEETKLALGSTIEGGDKGNTMADATAAETAMEAKNRPDGLHVTGVGNTNYPVGQGAVGQETMPAPNAPSNSPSGENSVIDQTKASSLREVIRKIAAEGMGSTIGGGDKGNTMAQAANVTGEAKLEANLRPESYATNARGKGWGEVPPAALIGVEQKHPHQPGESPSGTNSIIQASKIGEENPFIALFAKTAKEVGSFLPSQLSEEQKIAHVRHLMGLNETERTSYLGLLAKEAGATDDQAIELATKHAECAKSRYQNKYGHERKNRTHDNIKKAEMPAQLAAALGKEKGIEEKAESLTHEKKEEKEEKKEEEKKEGMDLLSRIRAISAAGA
jgi:hypothetical protein